VKENPEAWEEFYNSGKPPALVSESGIKMRFKKL
jgi:hypothetical protein